MRAMSLPPPTRQRSCSKLSGSLRVGGLDSKAGSATDLEGATGIQGTQGFPSCVLNGSLDLSRNCGIFSVEKPGLPLEAGGPDCW